MDAAGPPMMDGSSICASDAHNGSRRLLMDFALGVSKCESNEFELIWNSCLGERCLLGPKSESTEGTDD